MIKILCIILVCFFIILFTNIFFEKHVKKCAKKSNYNCNICDIYDCPYKYCGKKNLEECL